VTILTTAANASMDRLKNEARSKLAGHALRLALRRKRVIATVPTARALFDAREHHRSEAEKALRRRPDAGPAARGRPLTEKQSIRVQDAADRALADDLAAARRRYTRVADAAEKALAESLDPKQQKSSGLGGLRNRLKASSPGKEGPSAIQQAYEDALRPEASAQDETYVYWRPSKREAACMQLASCKQLVDDAKKHHDHELEEFRYKQAREAAKEAAREARKRGTELLGLASPNKTVTGGLRKALEWMPDEDDLTIRRVAARLPRRASR